MCREFEGGVGHSIHVGGGRQAAGSRSGVLAAGGGLIEWEGVPVGRGYPNPSGLCGVGQTSLLIDVNGIARDCDALDEGGLRVAM